MNTFGTEIIELASDGFFYPSDSILASGVVEMLPLTAADEDMLSSGNLLKRNLVLPRILTRILPAVTNIDEILHCDVVSILLNARILNYGSTNTIKSKCANCSNEFEHEVSFGFKPIPFSFAGLHRGRNVLGFVLPRSGKFVAFRLPTWREHLHRNSVGWIEHIKNLTLSIEDEPDISEFYNNLCSGFDSRALREYIDLRTPGFVTKWTSKCPECGNTTTTSLDITTDIFNIRPESKSVIHDEIFSLCYHTNGGFTQDSVYNMPTKLRNFYLKKLVDLKNDENEQTKKREAEVKAMSKTSGKPSGPMGK